MIVDCYTAEICPSQQLGSLWCLDLVIYGNHFNARKIEGFDFCEVPEYQQFYFVITRVRVLKDGQKIERRKQTACTKILPKKKFNHFKTSDR